MVQRRILSAAMLVRWLGERRRDEALGAVASAVERSVTTVLGSGVSTPDLGGAATTRSLTDAIVAAL